MVRSSNAVLSFATEFVIDLFVKQWLARQAGHFCPGTQNGRPATTPSNGPYQHVSIHASTPMASFSPFTKNRPFNPTLAGLLAEGSGAGLMCGAPRFRFR